MESNQADKAIRYIMENAPLFAQAKANRVFIENYLRTVKSRLMNDESGTLGAKEAYAYAHADYVAQLEGLKVATEEEERLRYMQQLNVDLKVQNAVMPMSRVADMSLAKEAIDLLEKSGK